jgi:PhoH-like ATPase
LALCLGSAGTGKTTLALSYALEQKMLHDKKIVLSKAAVPIGRGKAFGPVPGDIKEKYAPYLSSYEIVLKKILGPKSKGYIRAMFEKQDIKYEPIEFVRGNTYEDCIFILDECQNLDWHELKTVISRIGQGSKIILLGDVYQSDVYFKHPQESGVQKLLYSNQFQNSPYTFNIELTKQYRGPLADLIYKIDNERKDT